MNLLLSIGLAISCVVLIVAALLVVQVGLLRSVAAAPQPRFGDAEDDERHHQVNLAHDRT